MIPLDVQIYWLYMSNFICYTIMLHQKTALNWIKNARFRQMIDESYNAGSLFKETQK